MAGDALSGAAKTQGVRGDINLNYGILLLFVALMTMGCQTNDQIDGIEPEKSKTKAHFSHEIVSSCPFGHTRIRHIPYRLGGNPDSIFEDVDEASIVERNDSIIHPGGMGLQTKALYERDFVYGAQYDVNFKKWYIACIDCGYSYDQIDQYWSLTQMFEIDILKYQISPNPFIVDTLLQALNEDEILNYEQKVYPDNLYSEYIVIWPQDSLTITQHADYLGNILESEFSLDEVEIVQINQNKVILNFIHNSFEYSIEFIPQSTWTEVGVHSSGEY